jgi:tetratricopeptide (TPR) repeat protein
MAYLQSFQYVTYLKKVYGPKAVGELLDAYRQGLDTTAALDKVCRVPKAEFEKGYRRHLQELVKSFTGRPPEKAQSLKVLKEAHAKDPGNPDVAARLADRYLLLGDKKEASRLVREVLAKHKNHALASYVQARLDLEQKEVSRAVSTLEAAVNPQAPDVNVLKLLGKLQLADKKFDAAARTFELGHKLEPYESTWLVQLSRAYLLGKQEDKLINVLKELAPTSADDLDVRVKLSQLLLRAGRHAEAERYAREALEIDVLDRDAQETLIAALMAQNKEAELQTLRKLLGR